MSDDHYNAYLAGMASGAHQAHRLRDYRDAKSAVFDAAIWLALTMSFAIRDARSPLVFVWLGMALVWVYNLVRSVRRVRRMRRQVR